MRTRDWRRAQARRWQRKRWKRWALSHYEDSGQPDWWLSTPIRWGQLRHHHFGCGCFMCKPHKRRCFKKTKDYRYRPSVQRMLARAEEEEVTVL